MMELLLQRSSMELGRYRRVADGEVTFELTMPKLRIPADWSQSATRKLSAVDLVDLQRKSPKDIAAWIITEPKRRFQDPELETFVVIEYIMHGDERKAKEVTGAMLARRPGARLAFQNIFGMTLFGMLTEPDRQSRHAQTTHERTHRRLALQW